MEGASPALSTFVYFSAMLVSVSAMLVVPCWFAVRVSQACLQVPRCSILTSEHRGCVKSGTLRMHADQPRADAWGFWRGGGVLFTLRYQEDKMVLSSLYKVQN